MHASRVLGVLASLLVAAEAWNAPSYNGYTRNFQATFIGAKGNAPNPVNWNIVKGDQNDNNEFQRYTGNKANLAFSGDGTLQIIPKRDASAPKGWTSARIEGKKTVTPKVGKITRVEASIRLAGNPQKNKQGIWPAFWMMGDSYRKGKAWPGCGEVDILESINGQPKVYGVVHCDSYPGGICNEPNGLVTSTAMSDNKHHVYRLEFDRRNSNFRKQTMTWYIDGKKFHQVTGAQINNANVWATLCHSPLYFVLNVAIGGDWPGPPNADTWGGTGSMMEIGYVAHYTSR